jgi:hypothetical protein
MSEGGDSNAVIQWFILLAGLDAGLYVQLRRERIVWLQ